MASVLGESEVEDDEMTEMGSYRGKVKVLRDDQESPAEEIMLLWGIQQPTFSKPNSFVSQSSLQLRLDACGRSLSILQSPSSLVRYWTSASGFPLFWGFNSILTLQVFNSSFRSYFFVNFFRSFPGKWMLPMIYNQFQMGKFLSACLVMFSDCRAIKSRGYEIEMPVFIVTNTTLICW